MIQEVTEIFGNYYGFVSPLLDATVAAPSGALQKAFFQLLGLADTHADSKDYTKSTHYFAAVAFFEAHAKQTIPLAGTWDLLDDVVSPLKYSTRLKYLKIHEVQTVDDLGKVRVSQLFCFDIPAATIPWKLAVVHPADALLVCRLPPNMGLLALTLFPPGLWTMSLPELTTTATYTHEHCYLANLTCKLHFVVAGSFGVSQYRRSVYPKLFGSLPNVEDELATLELDLLCGAYDCVDEQSGHRALKSWWPLSRFYEKPENGENYGHWCNRREQWYLARVEDIEKRGHETQPLTYTGWKSSQRGVNIIRKFHTSVQGASLNFIRQNISSVSP